MFQWIDARMREQFSYFFRTEAPEGTKIQLIKAKAWVAPMK